MASVYITPRLTKSGVRFIVRYRTGGRGPLKHAGSYKTHTEAERVREMVGLRIAGLDKPIWPPTVPPSGVSIVEPSVYFARLGDLIKIGIAKDPVRRARQLNAELLYAEGGGRTLEAELHQRFAHLRERGEWFRADPSLLGYIAAMQELAA